VDIFIILSNVISSRHVTAEKCSFGVKQQLLVYSCNTKQTDMLVITTFQLGIELGLDIVTLQSIEIKHRVNRSNKSSVAKMEIREMFTQTNKLSIKNISKITEASREIK
jgi:hypothetical protein